MVPRTDHGLLLTSINFRTDFRHNLLVVNYSQTPVTARNPETGMPSKSTKHMYFKFYEKLKKGRGKLNT